MVMQMPETKFVIEEIHYFPTRNHVPMHLRPYVFNTDAAAIDTIAMRMEQNKSGVVTPAILSGVSNGIVQPSAVGIESTVNNSWVSNRRFIFMMKVRHVDFQGLEICTYVFGYTEYDGITNQGNIDTNMVHYINNVIETTAQTYQTPLGLHRSEKLSSVYNTIYSTGGGNDIYAQRPVDIYQTFSMNEMASYGGLEASFHNASNMVTPFSNNIISSTTENSITTEYLSKILTSGLHAFKAREVHVNAFEMGSNDPVEKFFTEPSLADCAFVRAISRVAGYRSVQGNFTFATLMQMDPTTYDRFQLFNFTNDFSNPILSKTPEVGESWNGQDMITTKAYSLIENAVSMANKYGFTKLSFIVNNTSDVIGTVNYGILDFKSFLSLGQQDMNYLLEIFKEKFNTEVFLNETSCGRITLHMECHVDLLGTSKIYLEYAGYPGVWFTIPTFANSLFAPVVCNSQTMVDHAASHIGNALSEILGAQPVYQY